MVDPHNKPEVDSFTGVETTGHDWDGIKELNNPAPRWWLIVFILCCVWSVGYWVVYPAWPTISGATKGAWAWTQYQELAESQAEIVQRQSAYLDRFEKASFAEIQSDPALQNFAVAGGAAMFKDNCATCHGTGAAGGPGYPNLNDDDWLWGGTIEDIYATIKHGVRNENPDSRQSQMPAFGKDGILDSKQVHAVVDYVLSLSEGAGDKDVSEGATIYAENCAACHADNGKGLREFGAPNLTDKIWLFGGTKEAVYSSVFYAHAGVMPDWSKRLDENTIRQLAVYVHSLGGGEKTPVQQ